MLKTLFTARFSKTLGIPVMAGVALAVASAPSKGADQIQPPPYEIIMIRRSTSVVSV